MLLSRNTVTVFSAVITALILILAACSTREAEAMTYYGIEDGYTYGATTSDGSAFDPYGSTAASLDIPLGSIVTACGPLACEDVLVNDVGGGYGVEGLDVTKGVALDIGLI